MSVVAVPDSGHNSNHHRWVTLYSLEELFRQRILQQTELFSENAIVMNRKYVLLFVCRCERYGVMIARLFSAIIWDEWKMEALTPQQLEREGDLGFHLTFFSIDDEIDITPPSSFPVFSIPSPLLKLSSSIHPFTTQLPHSIPECGEYWILAWTVPISLQVNYNHISSPHPVTYQPQQQLLRHVWIGSIIRTIQLCE